MANLPVAYAESSNAANIHRFLRFTDLPNRERYQKLKNLEVFSISSIDWYQMEMFDPSGLLARLLPPNTPWRRFFDILEPSYDELVYEFLSTFYFKYDKSLTDESIHFRLCGQSYNMSLTEFAVHLGIYTDEEVKQPIFTEASTSYSPEEMKEYWLSHSSKEWCNNNNSMKFIDPRYQYMHRVLANTITGRKNNQHRVSATDLFHLHSIFEQVPCNIAHELATYLLNQQTNPLRSLMGGSYITKIAKSLGVLSNQIIQGLSPPKASGIVNFNSVRLTPVHNYILNQPFQSEEAQVILESTSTQNLQQSLLQLPRPSFYRFDLQPQLPPVQEHITTNLSQPNILQNISPLVFEEDSMMQQTLFDENMIFQEQLASESFLQSPLPQQFFQSLLNEVEQQLPPINTTESCTVPQLNLPSDSIGVEVARLNDQIRNLSKQIKRLTERNKWLEDMLKQIANSMQLTLPPSPPYDSESEFDSLYNVSLFTS
ncbi:hypothetical protein HanRHA438_Chr16g0771301 [Helianthus annuus]|nr:hypothetical protein HanRHA438_Chr16g0771301 [Helianthus annuus]